MLCSKCGVETFSSKIVCEECAKDETSSRINTWGGEGKSKVAESIKREQQELKKKLERIEYAHFALRALAVLVDFSILFLILRLVSISTIHLFGDTMERAIREDLPMMLGLASGNAFGFLSAYFVNQIAAIFITLGLIFILGIFYHAILECSVFQATPGKMLFGIAVGVVDKEQKSKVTAAKFRQTLLRHLVKGFPYFPFFAAFFSYVSSASESFRDIVFPTCVLLSVVLLFFNYLLVFITPKKQALQDIISQTIVFNKKNLELDRILQFASLTVFFFSLTQYLLYPQSILAGPEIQHRAVNLPVGISSAIVNELQVEFKDSFIFYHEDERRFQIAFFREELSEQDKEKITTEKSFIAIEDKKPDLISNINIRKGASDNCSYASIRGLSHAFYKNQGLFDFPGKLAFQSFPRLVSRTPSLEFSNFSCKFGESSKFTATMQGSIKTTGVDGKENLFSWNLIIDKPIHKLSAEDERMISYNSEKSTSIVAVFIPEDRKLEIGFFPSLVTFEEMAYIISTRSISGLTKKQPEVILKLKIAKDSEVVALDSIVSSEVIFNRKVGQIDFPGDENKISFSRKGSFDALSDVAGFSGLLQNEERLRGSFEGSSVATIDEQEYYFDWNLVVDTTLYVAEELIDPDQLEKERFPEIKEATLGYLKVNKKQYDFAKARAKYDQKNNMLDVSLFVVPPEAVDEKPNTGGGSKQVESSQTEPQVRLFFELKKDQKKFITENIEKLTISLYREKFGSFYFPGDLDVKNIVYKNKELLNDKELQLSGTIQLGNALIVRMKGLNEIPKAKLSWKLNIEALVEQ